MKLRAVIFDLGDTLLRWPEWLDRVPQKWGASYDTLGSRFGELPPRDAYIKAMREAEEAHWERVRIDHWSGPPSSVVTDGLRRLGVDPDEALILAVLDAYADALKGWSVVEEGAVETLIAIRELGLRLGLLSNTWWAAEWHNSENATHGLGELMDTLVYTSDLAHSKPHPSVFLEVAGRLGVQPEECVMIGDRLIDDVLGAQSVGMRGIWRRNDITPRPAEIRADAEVDWLIELVPIIQGWAHVGDQGRP